MYPSEPDSLRPRSSAPHVREYAAVFHGALQSLARGDLIFMRKVGFFVDDIARGTGHGLHGLNQGTPAANIVDSVRAKRAIAA